MSEDHIPAFRISHSGSSQTDETSIEDHRYPFAGSENPRVKLGFVEVAPASASEEGGEDVEWNNWEKRRFFAPPQNSEEYLARVDWLPDDTICAQWEDRKQSLLNVVRIDPKAEERGKECTILLTEFNDEVSGLSILSTVLTLGTAKQRTDTNAPTSFNNVDSTG